MPPLLYQYKSKIAGIVIIDRIVVKETSSDAYFASRLYLDASSVVAAAVGHDEEIKMDFVAVASILIKRAITIVIIGIIKRRISVTKYIDLFLSALFIFTFSR